MQKMGKCDEEINNSKHFKVNWKYVTIYNKWFIFILEMVVKYFRLSFRVGWMHPKYRELGRKAVDCWFEGINFSKFVKIMTDSCARCMSKIFLISIFLKSFCRTKKQRQKKKQQRRKMKKHKKGRKCTCKKLFKTKKFSSNQTTNSWIFKTKILKYITPATKHWTCPRALFSNTFSYSLRLSLSLLKSLRFIEKENRAKRRKKKLWWYINTVIAQCNKKGLRAENWLWNIIFSIVHSYTHTKRRNKRLHFIRCGKKEENAFIITSN